MSTAIFWFRNRLADDCSAHWIRTKSAFWVLILMIEIVFLSLSLEAILHIRAFSLTFDNLLFTFADRIWNVCLFYFSQWPNELNRLDRMCYINQSIMMMRSVQWAIISNNLFDRSYECCTNNVNVDNIENYYVSKLTRIFWRMFLYRCVTMYCIVLCWIRIIRVHNFLSMSIISLANILYISLFAKQHLLFESQPAQLHCACKWSRILLFQTVAAIKTIRNCRLFVSAHTTPNILSCNLFKTRHIISTQTACIFLLLLSVAIERKAKEMAIKKEQEHRVNVDEKWSSVPNKSMTYDYQSPLIRLFLIHLSILRS